MAFKTKSYLYNVVFKRLAVPVLDGEGKPLKTRKGETRMMNPKLEFPIKVPYGKRADYEAHWKQEGLNIETTLDGILNQLEKQSKEGFKAGVREAVLAVEEKIYTPKLTLPQLTKACLDDSAVKQALEAMQANVLANHIGQPRNKDVTKTQAAQIGIELLQKDPDLLKEIAKQLGVTLPNS